MITSLVDAEDVGLVVPTQGRGALSSRSPMFGVVVGVVTCFTTLQLSCSASAIMMPSGPRT